MGYTCHLKIRGKVLKPGPEAAGPRVKPLPGADLNHSAVSSGTMAEKLSWNSEVMDRVWRTMGGGSCDGLSLRERSTPPDYTCRCSEGDAAFTSRGRYRKHDASYSRSDGALLIDTISVSSMLIEIILCHRGRN